MDNRDETEGRELRELDKLRANLAEAGLMPEPEPVDEDEPELRAVETAVGPWRRRGDIIEPAAPLGPGPTRYRVIERTERRVRWRPPYVPTSTTPGPDDDDWVTWDDETRPGPHWYDFSDELLGEFYPGPARRDHRAPFYAPRLSDPEAEPDVIPWDELSPVERERLRLTEYELPWEAYEVTVPYLPGEEELTPEQEALWADRHHDDEVAAAARYFLSLGQTVVELPPATGEKAGRRAVDAEAWRDYLAAAVGPVELVQRLTPPGRPSAGLRAERIELARRIAQALGEHAGSRDGKRIVAAMVSLYGRSRHTFYALARLGGWKLRQ